MTETILVTGGAGFIGSHTADLLLRRGYRVRILDCLLPPVHRRDAIPEYVPSAAEFLRGDVRDPDAVDRALDGVAAVLHLAAYQDYRTDFSTFASVNGVGTALLYERIVERRWPVRKVVVASSQSVYGEGAYVCDAHGTQYPPPRDPARLARRLWDPICPVCGGPICPVPVDEARVHPHNAYAISKHSEELYALVLGRRYGIPSVALRYSITQGPRQSFRNAYSGILRIFTTRLLTGQAPVAYEDGRQLRDYVAVEDVAAANVLCLEDARADDQVFNVGGAAVLTVLEYAELVRRVIGGGPGPRVPGEYRNGDMRHVLSDSDKLRRLGWAPRVPLGTVVANYVAWARAQPDLADYYAAAERHMKAQGAVVQV